MHIKDRTFIISGGSSGLGLATARNVHHHGGYIAILDLNAKSGGKAVQELGKERSHFFECDVSDTESIEAAIKGVSEWVKTTGKIIGGVVSAAGVGNPGKVNILVTSVFLLMLILSIYQIIGRDNEPLSMSSIDFVLNINLRGTLDLVRQCLPYMTTVEQTDQGERGVIILVSSSAAFDGQPGQVKKKLVLQSISCVLIAVRFHMPQAKVPLEP